MFETGKTLDGVVCELELHRHVLRKLAERTAQPTYARRSAHPCLRLIKAENGAMSSTHLLFIMY